MIFEVAGNNSKIIIIIIMEKKRKTKKKNWCRNLKCIASREGVENCIAIQFLYCREKGLSKLGIVLQESVLQYTGLYCREEG